MAEEDWVVVGNLNDIPRAGARIVKTVYGNIGVFRTDDDRIFAIENRCPHLGGALSEGIVHATSVTCPLHNWVIDLATGNVLGADEGCVLTVPVQLDGDRISLDLSSPAARSAAA